MAERVIHWLLVLSVGVLLLLVLNVIGELLRPDPTPDVVDSSGDRDVAGDFRYHYFPSVVFVCLYGALVVALDRRRTRTLKQA